MDTQKESAHSDSSFMDNRAARLAQGMEKLNAISTDAYLRFLETSQEELSEANARIVAGLHIERVIQVMIGRGKLTAAAIKKYLIENSIEDITLQQFLHTHVEGFCSYLFKDYVIDMSTLTNSAEISENDIKEIILHETINQFKMVGKFAEIFTHKSITITVYEFIEDVMIDKFIRFIAECKNGYLIGDVIGDVLQKYTAA